MGIRNNFRVLVGALVLLFFSTNVLLAYTPEKNFWVERRQSAARRNAGTILANIPTVRSRSFPNTFAHFPEFELLLPEKIKETLPPWFLKERAELLRSLPYAEGSVRMISFPPVFSPGGPVVIHLQDVHQNLEAQRHIAAAVAALSARVDVIGLEGSTRPLDLARFRAFPDRNAVAIAAEESLAQNEITGPIHAALTAKDPFPVLVGIDDRLHYGANIEAYRQSAPRVAREKAKLKTLKASLENQKQTIFNPPLLKFDRGVTDYREGRATLSAHIKFLKAAVPCLSPELRRISQVLALEERLDFHAVESDRVRAVEGLAARLDKNALVRLTAQATAYRAGAIRYGDFYRFLRDLCARHGVMFGKDLDTYVRYVLLADSVDAGALFDELQAMETAVTHRLARTTGEKELIARSRHAYLTEKLLDFALTPAEWAEDQAAPTPGLETFKSFYREAHARDGAMARNLLSALSQIKANKPAPVGLLVTGGYHALGLTRELTEAGVTVISFVPKIEKIDTVGGHVALDIFTREKMPLQKLFEGETLFLGHDPLPEYEENLALPAKISLATLFDRTKTFLSFLGSSLRGRIAGVKESAHHLRVQFHNGDQMNSAFNPSAPKGSKFILTGIFRLPRGDRQQRAEQNFPARPEGNGLPNKIFKLKITPQLKESIIALSVAGLMGGFYFGVGVIYPPLFGQLSRPQSLLFILGTGILNGFTNWVLVNRAQKASHLPTISLGPMLGLNVLFFGPLYGFVGNDLLRLIPGIGFVPSYWVQALVGQFIVAPLVFDPLGYYFIRRFISQEPVKEILQSMKKNMIPYVILNAVLWTPIGALGLSFPNNAATNIVASVGGILATLVGNLFVIRQKLGFLNLDVENIEKIRFPPFRWMAQGMEWFYSRAWIGRYLMTLVVFGYAALVGIMAKEMNFHMNQPISGEAVSLAVSGVFGSIAILKNVGDLPDREAENTLRWIQPTTEEGKAFVIDKAWVNAGALGVSRVNGTLAWVRGMEEPLRLSEFRKAYTAGLAARKARFPTLSGPSDILNRFHVSMSNIGDKMTGLTVPLLIVSSEGMGEVEELLTRLEQMNQGGGNPIHVVLAGNTDDAVNRIKTMKGLRPFVHVVELPVVAGGVVDPAVLLAGIQAVPKIKELGSISWWVALSPGIRVDPKTLTVLGDEGLAGSLKTGLAVLTRVLNGLPLKPVDLNTLIDIVALVLGNA